MYRALRIMLGGETKVVETIPQDGELIMWLLIITGFRMLYVKCSIPISIHPSTPTCLSHISQLRLPVNRESRHSAIPPLFYHCITSTFNPYKQSYLYSSNLPSFHHFIPPSIQYVIPTFIPPSSLHTPPI